MTEGIHLARLHRLLDDDATVRDLRRYFAERPATGLPYTGRRFEALAGGGDRPETANRITADDLVALTTLSVSVPAEAAIDLLDGALGEQLTLLLVDIPTGIPLTDERAGDLVADGSRADRAWHLLTGVHGIQWVTAAKILARKRPHLLPVYDNVVRCVLNEPNSFWSSLHAALRDDGCSLDHQLQKIRTQAGLDARISTIRVLDVALWMRHHVEHVDRNCHRVTA